MSSRGTIMVTPVRTGPCPMTSGPSPAISVVCPTRIPSTSVIAFHRPVANRPMLIPSSRARTRTSAGATPVPIRALHENEYPGRCKRLTTSETHHILRPTLGESHTLTHRPFSGLCCQCTAQQPGDITRGGRMVSKSASSLNRRRFVQGSAALSAALAMSRPAFSPNAGAQEGGEQVLRLACEEPETFDLGTIGGGIGIQWANHLFEGLTVYDWENQQVVPGAAETWDISTDNLTYTFHLRAGMLWSDGSPLTAHDFEYAIKRNLEPELAGPLATFLYPIKGAEEYFV